MNEPVTSIDPRFSDPGAVATPWDETRRVLETAELFWISTIRADGRPHITPLVAVWLDGALYFTTGATEQKAKNLHGNPRVILMTGCNAWDAGLDVVVEGDAVRITDDDMLQRLASVWATKWDGRWQYEGRGGGLHHKHGGWPSCSRSSPPRSSHSLRAPSATHVISSDFRHDGSSMVLRLANPGFGLETCALRETVKGEQHSSVKHRTRRQKGLFKENGGNRE